MSTSRSFCPGGYGYDPAYSDSPKAARASPFAPYSRYSTASPSRKRSSRRPRRWRSPLRFRGRGQQSTYNDVVFPEVQVSGLTPVIVHPARPWELVVCWQENGEFQLLGVQRLMKKPSAPFTV
jgi:hypothetical protein